MYHGGYTAEITSLSPKVTEKDLRDFFAYCGVIEHVEIIRCGEYACTAYVTFKDPYSLETAVLLSVSSTRTSNEGNKLHSFSKRKKNCVLSATWKGATIVDQSVWISRWGSYDDDSYPWDGSSWKAQEDTSSTVTHMHPFVSSPGEAVTVVKTMLAKGYVLGKDALVKAKDLDESYRVSATAAAKVAELSNRIGLTDKINTSMETVKSVDEKYHVSDITKSVASVTGTAVLTAASFTGRTAVAASDAVVNSSYFAKGALWVSGMLNRAAQAAADLGSHGNKQTPS
ncbi:binding partner of ACD11 1-like isoform X1 [Hibiscus syriacus]|uniref:binding partner of ACD11 1-like isoform X1 n=1 Tax=Hibiscus syriacus TaxID=106335 RepID=UPI0019235DA9|nr:binding partner of ACD11 1-like isoform X1 [Hibiscus syriacus]XP_039011262.1 binding partner of ACD11 1-like isoform X1 [Hibiscus syriacus]XP_039011263.1 binding partner of ACD11 1-like isoform X1 [Hibiscus syriacus]